MSNDTFLNTNHWRWSRFALLLVTGCSIWYYFDAPLFPKSGSTFYGYTIGILCGVIMAYLLWYGVRKRSYFSSYTTLKEVLSIHVWVGIALLILIPLHCGFQFNWNVHTLTAIFCFLTIVTGIWGIFLYQTLPEKIGSHRGGGTVKNLIEQFDTLQLSLRKIEQGKSDSFLQFVSAVDTYRIPTLPMLLCGQKAKPLSKEKTADVIRTVSASEHADALAVLGLIDKRYNFLMRIEKEVLVQFWIKSWLITHIPLACGAMLLLLIHIFSVLYFGKP